MRVRALLALSALLMTVLGGAAGADEAPPAACLIVYGQARNVGEVAQNEAWDRINARFNALVTGRLRTAGLQAQSLVFKVGMIDLPFAVQALTARAAEQGCSRVVDTAVFADENGALVVRLRVHPLLGSLGPVVAPGTLRIGEALYTSQSEFDLNLRTLERLKLEALAASMVEGYLAEQAATVKRSAAAASRSQ